MKAMSGQGELLLYLDFDGVLHPERVWWHPTVGPYLSDPGEDKLFQHATLLERLLAPYPDVRIILSTTWVRHYGVAKSAKELRPALRQRVIGATFHNRMNQEAFAMTPRGQQVWSDVQKRKPRDWLALDDCPDGWPPEAAGRFIRTDPHQGLGHPGVLIQFKQQLEAMHAKKK